jgi:hypothetical protein
MFEYMGQGVTADILVQRGKIYDEKGGPYKAFKRLHWKLKLPQGDFSQIECTCLVIPETFNCFANWFPI